MMVHVFSMNGYYIALDVNSGSIHVLDKITYDILKNFSIMPSEEKVIEKFKDRYPVNQIKEAYSEIKKLEEEGVLFTPDCDTDQLINRLSANTGVKAFCLHVAHDCNLRCSYCFASKGDYKSGRKLMSVEVARRAVDFLIENSGKRRNIEIDFFGGEPLLNFEVVKDTVEYGRKQAGKAGKEFYFTITTNGTLLDDDKIDFINENMDNVVISIDGRKEVHDAVRHDKTGNGTYDRIVPAAIKLVERRAGKEYFIRGTFTSRNLDFSRDVLHLADLGFKEISIEPVVGQGEDFHITKEHLPAICKEYEKLAKAYIDRMKEGRPFRFYHFNLNLYGGPCLYKRITACGAGFEYFAVSPEGDIYPCHQFVGQPEFKMGNVFSGIRNKEISKRFKENNVLTKEKCSQCWAKFYCSGGCHANAYYTNGDISIPAELACEMQKKRIECAIMIEVVRAGVEV